MKRTTYPQVITNAAVALLLLCALWTSVLAARKFKKDIWEINENLSLRLTAEWHKIGVLKREASAITDVLTAMRDLELYPSALTGFNDKRLIQYDKSIEALEKRNRRLAEEIDAFGGPLTDALAIFREMLIDEPVESMFKVLENGNLKRINLMLGLKHSIDTLWRDTDSLLSLTMREMDISTNKADSGKPIEDEFFTILKANLGLQSDQYYSRLNVLKDYLIKKASEKQVGEMVRIEKHRINEYISEGKLPLARRKIDDAISRYAGHIDIDEFNMLMIKVRFLGKEYHDVLKILKNNPGTVKNVRISFLYRIQSLYALHEYEEILADTSQSILLDLTGADLNLALWMIIESALTLNQKEKAIRFASFTEKNKPYTLHILHALARSYLAAGDDTTALSILEQAQNTKVTTPDDQTALQEIRMAIAMLYYEQEKYDKAIELFYTQLNNENMFERALLGISWSYLQSGRFEKAEIALKKLINQAPDKSWGAEGILILARRNLQNATFAWKKTSFINREKERLSRMLRRLDMLESADINEKRKKEFAFARSEISSVLKRVNEEKLSDYASIVSLYDNADHLCSFISSHYYTGSFQEISFSKNREVMLNRIDSVLFEIEHSRKADQPALQLSNARQQRMKIKNIVDQASLFSTISLIARYQWEREYLDWRKTLLKKSDDTTNDTAGKKPAAVSLDSTLMDSLLVREDSLRIQYSAILKSRIRQLLASSLDSADASYLCYQLGEIYYQEENARYVKTYEAYDKKVAAYSEVLEKYRNGKIVDPPQEPVMPTLTHDSSIVLFQSAIAEAPSSQSSAAAHYSLAWCYNDLSEFDRAYTHMYTVASKFPDNPYAAQAWMFCGEYHFDKGNLKDALTSFYTVMQYPESEWFDEALYKVAWTQYRLSNPEKAISSFLALVDLGEGKSGQALLEKESMDYIAISFSETDATGEKGLRRAAKFARKLGDVSRGCQILHRLGQVFRDQGRYDMAKKTFNLILSSYPKYQRNPTVEAELLSVLEREETTERSIDQKYGYFLKYNRKSKWAQNQTSSVRSQADSIAAKMLYDAAISYHQFALQKNNNTYYKRALQTYKDYISNYPRSSLTNECHYNLAEIQFSLGNYRDAAEEYIAVSKRYPDSKYKETAAWNAIVASQNLLKVESDSKIRQQP